MHSEKNLKELLRGRILTEFGEEGHHAEHLAASSEAEQVAEEISHDRHDLSTKKQYYFWREQFIPFMILLPLLLFVVVLYILFWPNPDVVCSQPGMCEDTKLWTKSIFVSGSFVTLVSFYTTIAKGLFGDKIRDRDLVEKAGNIAQPVISSSSG